MFGTGKRSGLSRDRVPSRSVWAARSLSPFHSRRSSLTVGCSTSEALRERISSMWCARSTENTSRRRRLAGRKCATVGDAAVCLLLQGALVCACQGDGPKSKKHGPTGNLEPIGNEAINFRIPEGCGQYAREYGGRSSGLLAVGFSRGYGAGGLTAPCAELTHESLPACRTELVHVTSLQLTARFSQPEVA